MVLQCSDGRGIPCVRYYCMSTCEVIRNLAEDVELAKDARGRAVVPFPMVSSTDLALAVEVIHGARTVSSLTDATAPATLRGLQALGHTAHTAHIMEHLWRQVCDGGMLDLHPHLNELLHTVSVRLPALRKLVVLCPTWPEFRDRVLGEVRMDAPLATYLLQHLSKFFPAGPLFAHILSVVPLAALNAASALAMFTAPKNAPSFHPAEAVEALHALAAKFEEGGWDPALLDLFRALLTAAQVYDVAPHAANTMHGTIVLLENTPVASLLLAVQDRKAVAVTRKMAPWMSLTADWLTGVVDAKFCVARLDDGGRHARCCQVRLTAYGDGSCGLRCAELWYVFEGVNPLVAFNLSDGQYGAGCVESFRSLMRSSTLARLRIDLFYGGHNVLHRAFF